MENKKIVLSLEYIKSIVDRFEKSVGDNRLDSETNTFANGLKLTVNR